MVEILNKITEEMEGYVCDSLCRYRNDSGMSQGELEEACKNCPLHIYTSDIKKYAGKGNRFHATRTA